MNIHWGSLLNVIAVSVSATVAVVSLVTVGLVGLSGRAAPTGQADAPTGPDLRQPPHARPSQLSAWLPQA